MTTYFFYQFNVSPYWQCGLEILFFKNILFCFACRVWSPPSWIANFFMLHCFFLSLLEFIEKGLVCGVEGDSINGYMVITHFCCWVVGDYSLLHSQLHCFSLKSGDGSGNKKHRTNFTCFLRVKSMFPIILTQVQF